MTRFFSLLSIAIIVGIMAMVYLDRNFSDIDMQTRVLISLGGAILSGVFSYFLLGNKNKEDNTPTSRKK